HAATHTIYTLPLHDALPIYENETKQSAKSEASSDQQNINVPVTADSPWSNNGHVDQSNKAENNASSQNDNQTDQQNKQDQGAAAVAVTNNNGDSGQKGNSGQKGDTSNGES